MKNDFLKNMQNVLSPNSVLIPVASSFSFYSLNAFLFLPNTHKKLFPLQNRTKKFSFPISNFVFFCNCKKKLLKNQYIVAKSYTIRNGASLVNKGNCNFFPLFGQSLVHSR